VEIGGERISRTLPGTQPVLLPNHAVATVAGDDVRFWDLAGGHETPAGPLHHDRPIRSLAVNADGTRAATATDRAIHIWEIRAGAAARPIAVHPVERADNLAFDPTGQLLRAMGYARTDIWSVAAWEKKLPDAPQDCHASPVLMDAKWRMVLQTCGKEAHAWTWDGSRFTGPRSRPHDGHVYNSAVSPHERLVATATATGAEIWDATTGGVRHSVTLGAPADRLAFSADGRALAVVDRDGKLQLLDVTSGKPRWKADSTDIGRLEFVRNDQLLIAEEKGVLQVRNVAGGEPGARIALSIEGARRSRDVEWSLLADDLVLVVAGNRARLWSLSSGEPVQSFGHPTRVQGSFSASGEIKYVLADRVTREGRARFWTGLKARFLGATGQVQGSAYLVTATAMTFDFGVETRVWAVGADLMQQALRRVIRSCLPVADRVASLGRTAEQAESEYKDCASRTP
jgi:WD40 repeat protein